MTYEQIKSSVLAKGYIWFNSPTQLNIIAERINYEDTNTFKDIMHVCYISEIGEKIVYEAIITTLPGFYWLEHPMNINGCAIIKEGQYIDSYQIGKHFEQNALVECKPIIVWRDSNGNNIIDLVKTENCIPMCNIHHANDCESVGKWSAGCIVFKSTSDHDTLMILAQKQVDFLKYDKFTLTVILKDDLAA